MHEFSIIQKYFAPLSIGEKGAMMLNDDAALVQPLAGMQLVYTKDVLVSGTHFFFEDDPRVLAQKLLAVNVSDLAAMGASPRGYLLGLALPSGIKEKWIAAFAKGLEEGLQRFGGVLLGGDTTSHKTENLLMLSLTAIGEVPDGQALKRNGAQVGDDVYVTGTIGDAALGLKLLNEKSQGSLTLTLDEQQFLLSRYHLPSPRQDWAQALRNIATSCVDVSDGLVADAGHIAKASSVAMELQAEKLPVSCASAKLLSSDAINIKLLLTGGDDYELCFTAPTSQQKAIEMLSSKFGVKATKIGKVIDGEGVSVFHGLEQLAIQTPGYRHF